MKKVVVFGDFPKSPPSKNNPLSKLIKKAMELTEKKGGKINEEERGKAWKES